MSQSKYSNKLCEKLITKSTPEQRVRFIEEVCEPGKGGEECPLVVMIKDKYANFTVQVLLLLCIFA